MVLALPFERIPSVDTALGTVKINHFLVVIAFYLLGVLLVKQDKKLLSIKISPVFWFILLFFVLSLPSIAFVQNFNRFLSTYLGVVLAMSTLFFVTHFLKDVWKAFVQLSIIWIGILVFGGYQFLADMIGLPSFASGVKPLFQKHVFGIPRIHTTFNEPSYYANALFMPIVAFLILYIRDINIFVFKDLPRWIKNSWAAQKSSYHTMYLLVLLGLVASFVATLAKSAWIVAPFVIIPLYLLLWVRGFVPDALKKLSVVSVLVASIVFLYFAPIDDNNPINNFYNHALESLSGDSSTVAERSVNFDSAVHDIMKNPIWGYGSGQFGVVSNPNIAFRNKQIQDRISNETVQLKADNIEVIVFNVYAEVWLEFGLFGLIMFLLILGYAVVKTFAQLWGVGIKNFSNKQIVQFVVLMYIIASLIQWNFISPIYINPIFISLGLLYNALQPDEYA